MLDHELILLIMRRSEKLLDHFSDKYNLKVLLKMSWMRDNLPKI